MGFMNNDLIPDYELQLEILEGKGYGGVFNIMPIKVLDEDYDEELGNIEYVESEQISIDEDYIAYFLSIFVEKHLSKDLAFQIWGNECEFDGFEWYEDNVYSYSDIKNMIADIKEVTKLLETDYDNPLLEPVKKYLSHYYLTPLITRWTPEKEAAYIKENIGIVTDFYRRFMKRMEMMMQRNPDCSLIVFSGP